MRIGTSSDESSSSSLGIKPSGPGALKIFRAKKCFGTLNVSILQIKDRHKLSIWIL